MRIWEVGCDAKIKVRGGKSSQNNYLSQGSGILLQGPSMAVLGAGKVGDRGQTDTS